jgi:hypothetical protein
MAFATPVESAVIWRRMAARLARSSRIASVVATMANWRRFLTPLVVVNKVCLFVCLFVCFVDVEGCFAGASCNGRCDDPALTLSMTSTTVNPNAPTTTTTTETTTTKSTDSSMVFTSPDAASPTNDDNNTTAIIIVVAVVVVCLLCIAIAIVVGLWIVKRKRALAVDDMSELPTPNDDGRYTSAPPDGIHTHVVVVVVCLCC